VAAFSPVIEQLSVTVKDLPLWWALLFGACFGGNITMIGSTANIVALGMLEKHGGSQINFFQWFKIGLLCTAVSGLIATGALLLLAPHMTDHKITFDKLAADSGYVPATEEFPGELVGTIELIGDDTFLKDVKSPERRIRVVLGDGLAVKSVKVRLIGTFVADKENAEFPYMLIADRMEEVRSKE
jgi:hypothetical protein